MNRSPEVWSVMPGACTAQPGSTTQPITRSGPSALHRRFYHDPYVETMESYDAYVDRFLFANHDVRRFETYVVMNRVKMGFDLPI